MGREVKRVHIDFDLFERWEKDKSIEIFGEELV